MDIDTLSSNLHSGRNSISRILRRLERKWNRKNRKEQKIKAYYNSRTKSFFAAVK